MERVKLAEVRSCCVVSGGLPCLSHHATAISQNSTKLIPEYTYLTRSAKVSGCNGKLARREISLSVTVFV